MFCHKILINFHFSFFIFHFSFRSSIINRRKKEKGEKREKEKRERGKRKRGRHSILGPTVYRIYIYIYSSHIKLYGLGLDNLLFCKKYCRGGQE